MAADAEAQILVLRRRVLAVETDGETVVATDRDVAPPHVEQDGLGRTFVARTSVLVVARVDASGRLPVPTTTRRTGM